MSLRRKEYEILDREIIEEILSNSEVCRIGLLDGDRAYIVPLNYGYEDNTLYFHTSKLGKKIELLRRDPRVCFEIELSTEIIKGELACEWTAKYRSVVGYGSVEFVTERAEIIEGLDIIMYHYGRRKGNVFDEKYLGGIYILKLKIEEITGKQLGEW